MKMRLNEIAQAIGARVIGDVNVEVSGVASIGSAGAERIVFVEDETNLAAASKSAAAAVIAGKFAESTESSKPLLIAANPRLAFARAAEMLRDRPQREIGVHPTAVVHPAARIEEGVSVGPRATVAENARIGARSWIAAGCAIGARVEIGEACEIYPNVTIYPGTQIGKRVIVHAGAVLGSDGFGYVRDRRTGTHEKFPQIGALVIEDDVEIGSNTTIDRGALETTHVGRGTKIDNLVHIGHNCQIGENVIIAAQAGFSGSIVVEDNVVIGGQAGIGEHARIKEGVMLGGQAGVLPKKILRGKGIAFWGTPAKPLKEYLRELAALARLGKKFEKK
jgi:UDP-3-O-[3-hydroxymyristoyl] glucosamine N-acyltransferase